MISSLTALFIVFAAVIGSTAMMALLGHFFRRIRQLEDRAGGNPGTDRLAESIDAMQQEVSGIRREMSELTERLDFTEKLLMGGDNGEQAEGGSEVRSEK